MDTCCQYKRKAVVFIVGFCVVYQLKSRRGDWMSSKVSAIYSLHHRNWWYHGVLPCKGCVVLARRKINYSSATWIIQDAANADIFPMVACAWEGILITTSWLSVKSLYIHTPVLKRLHTLIVCIHWWLSHSGACGYFLVTPDLIHQCSM